LPGGDRVQPLDFELLLRKMPLMVHVMSPDYTSLAASDVYLEAAMKTPETLYGRNVFEAFPDDPTDPDATGEADLRASLDRAARTGEPDWMAVQRYPVQLPDGSFEERFWSPFNTPIHDKDGRLRYIVQVVQEVTEFVRQREAAEMAGDDTDIRTMEAEILRRSSELHELNRRLHAASDAKNTFLSRMSHELRTPLTAILGFGELLSLEEPDAERASWIVAIRKAGSHLLEIVNEVLDISRIESGDLSLSVEPTPLDDVLRDALELMRPLAEAHAVTIASQAPRGTYVLADNQRLKQVLINLLSNAIKYNVEGGRVEVAIAQSDDRVRIDVIDTGRGIDDAAMAKLFMPFERLGASAAGIEGTGLGLALSHNLVEAMGGTLTAQSVVGAGSTFSVDLVRSTPVAVATGSDEDQDVLAHRSYAGPRRLLYIEDTVANARLVEQILLRRPSITVMPAMLGQLGIELARGHLPDMVLLDLHLPDLHGAEVLAELRADPRTRDVPVVILSADATERQIAEMRDQGASDYVTKPITVTRLLRVIDRFIEDGAPPG